MIPARPKPRRAFTIVEMAMCTLLSSLALVAAMRIVGSVGKARYKAAEREAGILFADGLMSEITILPYRAPGSIGIALEGGETAGKRSTYDDVDDYNGYTDAPPSDRAGDPLPGSTGWSRTVLVEYVKLASPDAVSGAPSGVKRITVTVRHNNATVVARSTLRTMH